MADGTVVAAMTAVASALMGGAGSPATEAPALPRAEPSTLIARVPAPVVARAAPRAGGRAVMRLRATTRWSGRRAAFMVTGRHRDAGGRRWVRVQLPLRPNGTSGWVPARAVRLAGTSVRIVVRLGARRLEVWRGARRVRSWPAGFGRAATPTPTGRFAVQDPVPVDPRARHLYSRHALILTAHSVALRRFMGGEALIAIHGTGTGQAQRVGRPSSYGCVILGDAALAATARYAAPGTPVVIRAT